MERYPPLLPGVWYSSFPIIAACLKVRAGWIKVLSQPASRFVRVASRSDRGLPQGPCGLPRGLIMGCLEVSCAGRLEVSGNKL